VLMGAEGLAVVATGPLVVSKMTEEPFIIRVREKRVKNTSSRFSVFSS
jgi:hypothetical protein